MWCVEMAQWQYTVMAMHAAHESASCRTLGASLAAAALTLAPDESEASVES